MNVGKTIETSILNYYGINYIVLIQYPAAITRLCILGEVEGTWEEKERCPGTSLLTLTGITRPPPIKGKKKVQEIEEEDRDGRENDQAIVLSLIKEREER